MTYKSNAKTAAWLDLDEADTWPASSAFCALPRPTRVESPRQEPAPTLDRVWVMNSNSDNQRVLRSSGGTELGAQIALSWSSG
jgi:hypothetical protein